jgi:RimJ/RimL family protein N-acetyltransferase
VRKIAQLKNADLLELSRAFLENGKSVRFQAKGWSMRPSIQDGDFVVVSPIENSSTKIGDVVFYSTAGNRVVVHRVINKYKKDGSVTIVIKGDVCLGSPERVNSQDVLGKVVAIERNGREKRLDTKLSRLTGLLLAGMSSFSHWIYPIGSIAKHSGRGLLGKILEELQSLKLYRSSVRKLIKESVHYKIATPEDASSLSKLYRYTERSGLENPTDALSEQFKKPEDCGYWFVAKRKGRIIGSVTLSEFSGKDYPYIGWWLFGMLVNWRYRGMGIGKKLTRMAMEAALEHGASEIKLFVFEDAKPANSLYQKAGFRRSCIPELDKQLEEETRKKSRRRIVLARKI